MQKFVFILIISAIGYFVLNQSRLPGQLTSSGMSSDNKVQEAFEQHLSDLQISGSGEIIRLLPDDIHGSRHQRFIIKTQTGQTVLIAHNIDLAPRISSLQEGDWVEFNGEYEWNEKGGVIHWTHHDPLGRHVSGWIKHKGHTYE